MGHFQERILMTNVFIYRFPTSFRLWVGSWWSLCTSRDRCSHHRGRIGGMRFLRVCRWRNTTHQNPPPSTPSSASESYHHDRYPPHRETPQTTPDRLPGRRPCRMSTLGWRICSGRWCYFSLSRALWTLMGPTGQVTCFLWSRGWGAIWTFQLRRIRFTTGRWLGCRLISGSWTCNRRIMCSQLCSVHLSFPKTSNLSSFPLGQSNSCTKLLSRWSSLDRWWFWRIFKARPCHKVTFWQNRWF